MMSKSVRNIWLTFIHQKKAGYQPAFVSKADLIKLSLGSIKPSQHRARLVIDLIDHGSDLFLF